MLSHIYIRNFAIIREIDIDLKDGLNIITGETGTGKSIVIQAINLALGGRGSSSLVADGQEKALVQLVFSLDENDIQRLPEDFRSLEDSELIVSREFNRNGKSLARINGKIVNLSVLSSVTAGLVDIHGQYDNQKLLNKDMHTGVLDLFAGKELAEVKARLSEVFKDYQAVRREIVSLRTSHSEYLRKQDFMKFEVDEINAADPKAGEDEELENRSRILQNGEKLHASLDECYDIIYNSRLDRAQALLETIADIDPGYKDLAQSLKDAVYAINDVCDEVRRGRDGISFSREELDATMIRLDLIDKLKLKYGGSIESVLAYRDRCAAEIMNGEDIEEREKELEKRFLELHHRVTDICHELSELRHKAALELSELMTRELLELNFAQPEFSVSITQNLSAKGKPVLTADGYDSVEFLFNASKGGALKSLADIASGGEISRIALAFKRITNDTDYIPTMIFDEIDTGISGITASVVGRKLHQIGCNHQILCITHLPQIAAAGDSQYLISRNDDEERSFTTIDILDRSRRIEELARLLGGDNITETTLASAAELLSAFER